MRPYLCFRELGEVNFGLAAIPWLNGLGEIDLTHAKIRIVSRSEIVIWAVEGFDAGLSSAFGRTEKINFGLHANDVQDPLQIALSILAITNVRTAKSGSFFVVIETSPIWILIAVSGRASANDFASSGSCVQKACTSHGFDSLLSSAERGASVTSMVAPLAARPTTSTM